MNIKNLSIIFLLLFLSIVTLQGREIVSYFPVWELDNKVFLNKNKSIQFLVLLLTGFFIVSSNSKSTTEPEEPEQNFPLGSIIPKPVTFELDEGSFVLKAGSNIYIEQINNELSEIGRYLTDIINSSTGFNMQVLAASGTPSRGSIYFKIEEDQSLGEEGYKISITRDLTSISANKPAGFFRAVQTIRQLLPHEIESSTVIERLWGMPSCTIIDYPRFEWRGIMLDVARHFFTVQNIKRLIDLAALYKINRFHIHLSDDQGWRIQINSWPNLAVHGGSTQVGGGPGGYYTQAEYSEIVEHAKKRYMIVVPEIDMPGHTNAALSSYSELNKNGIAPPLYTGINVGFSALDVNKEITYTFIDDVIRELSAITPGPYIHIGGDEVKTITSADYIKFINRVQTIVQSHGKEMIGWEEIAQSDLSSSSIAQHWAGNSALTAIQKGAKVIMSPASKAYLDMKYNSSTLLGLNWAGYIEVMTAYNWDPADHLNSVTDNNILGLEAPLWTETITNMDEIEFMVFPRLCGCAEIGWSQKNGRDWDSYKERLANHGLRLNMLDVNYYNSPQVPWAAKIQKIIF